MKLRMCASLALLAVCASVAPSTAAVVAPPAQHRFFGVLERANGTAITLRLRNGRLLAVDAAPAFALDRVAEPLFAGKPTVVEGDFSANGLFHANAVKRAAPRPASWGLDR
jgi:hypothetical protein